MERESQINFPTEEEIQSTKLFFIELEDALNHYHTSIVLPGVKHMSLTVRSNSDSEPEIELVTETRFPALDDMQMHFNRLKHVATKLDSIPQKFWEDLYSKQLKRSRDIPHVPLQTVLYGLRNEDGQNFQKTVNMYEGFLSDYAWADSGEYSFKDNAEQCKRIVYAYTKINEHSPNLFQESPSK